MVSQEERANLKRHARRRLSVGEEGLLVHCYEVLKQIVESSDAKTLDVLQVASPIFCFTEPGHYKMVQIFGLWEDIKHLPLQCEERQFLRHCVLVLAGKFDNLLDEIREEDSSSDED